MIRLVAALAVLILAAPAFAASEANCTDFVEAFKKASKVASGKDLADDDAGFWKKQCLKKTDAEVKKDTACLQKVKAAKDMGPCMK